MKGPMKALPRLKGRNAFKDLCLPKEKIVAIVWKDRIMATGNRRLYKGNLHLQGNRLQSGLLLIVHPHHRVEDHPDHLVGEFTRRGEDALTADKNAIPLNARH